MGNSIRILFIISLVMLTFLPSRFEEINLEQIALNEKIARVEQIKNEFNLLEEEGGVGKEMGNACETYKRYIQYVLLKDRYDRDGGPSKFQAILVNRAYEHGDDAAQKMYNIIKVSGFLRCRRPDGAMIPDSIAIEEMVDLMDLIGLEYDIDLVSLAHLKAARFEVKIALLDLERNPGQNEIQIFGFIQHLRDKGHTLEEMGVSPMVIKKIGEIENRD